ncbi:MAG: LytTR family DNA-binding domain-containing protein [Chitinophagaceae bacterium]|mgnify:FL=1|jgi:two-component system LytT family response regulator|nr:response regulator transcription factor [Bacteroidota bacterium]MBK9556503.1 response regulator transcription factor [Bacteroidota bacterium]MBP9879278.1 response regulator transcription factor [Chitinophagales bacterium]
MKCIIVEDEPLALERTKGYVEKLPFLKLLATFDNGVDALLFLKDNTIDLLFLDINLGELSGIQMLEAAKPDCAVIITTAYHEYALKGYELNVTDYLLKPFTFERFFQAVEKAKVSLDKKETPEKKSVFIKTEYRLEQVLLSDIIYIEGMRDYRRIFLTGKSIMTLQTFKELEEMIPPSAVCRVHKSYMVAVDKIESIEKDRIKIGKERIPISDTYKSHFFNIIGRK